MKVVYLHIGVGRTGTTSVQKYLSHHSNELREQGVHYVLSGGGHSGDGHQSFARSCISNVPNYMHVHADIDADRQEILREVRSAQSDIILLSSENFQLADPETVFEAFKNVNHSIKFKIILFVRSQDELLESEYNQLIKVRAETMALEDFRDAFFDGDFIKLAMRWGAVFGDENLVCRIYDGSRLNSIEDFLGCLPIDVSQMTDLLRGSSKIGINKSLSGPKLAEKLEQNRIQASESRHDPVMLNIPDVPAVLMDSEKARAVRDEFRQSNLLFTEKYLGIATETLGGRRYSDHQRDEFYACWKQSQRLKKRECVED